MKKLIAVIALICLGSSARAQMSLDEAKFVAQGKAEIASATPAAIPGWYQLHTFGGASGRWKLGLDKSPTAGACLERELHDGQWLAGPCRDILLLAKDSQVRFHFGLGAASNAEHGNTAFQLRLGFNVGPIAKGALAKAADSVPILEKFEEWNAPGWLSKIGDMTTLDFAGGPRPIHDASVNGEWTYGIGAKVDVPLDVIFGWLKSGL